MTNLTLTARASRFVALGAALALGLPAPLVVATSAQAAPSSAPPECVEYYSSWRYTSVVNSCALAVAVTVAYADGQVAPCRVIEPGGVATFAGYGPQLNYVTGLRTCESDPSTPLAA
ncbi:alpha-amylase [Streptomyces sp. NPDC053755]|uniref:alpha-amylase n=1 Tax=Streptomyces sp. NPDC053755 TaxID=3155815 RepID=UPI0034498213